MELNNNILHHKKSSIDAAEQCSTVYSVHFEMEQFPRYQYHAELVRNILKSSESADRDTITEAIPTVIQSTILVSGRVKEDDVELLKPLTVDKWSKTNASCKLCYFKNISNGL
jgi:hypothetical protein